ncbi:MAG: arabinofuranan 3-O-arabinosyltransferase, partial [Chloroflexota bacterium]|nr:arabinofuranan 3-O-arabinosyltransferase [Chloroflexota bacterium]
MPLERTRRLLRESPLVALLWLTLAAGVALEVYLSVVNLDPGDAHGVWTGVQAFLRHEPPYRDYGDRTVYAYPPGSFLVFAPLFALPLGLATHLMVAVNALSIAGAVVLLMRAMGWRFDSALVPLAGIAVATSAPVWVTMFQGNPNGPMLLAEAVFLAAALRSRWLPGALALGLGLSVKPLLAPLLLLLVLRRRWAALVVAVVVPAGLAIAAVVLVPTSVKWLTVSIPQLLRGSLNLGNVNSSLAGVLAMFGAPVWVG